MATLPTGPPPPPRRPQEAVESGQAFYAPFDPERSSDGQRRLDPSQPFDPQQLAHSRWAAAGLAARALARMQIAGERARELRELEAPGERPVRTQLVPQRDEILHPHDFSGGPRIIASRGRAATMHELPSVPYMHNEPAAPPALGERERAGSMVALIGEAPTLEGRRRGSTLNTAEI